MRGAHHRRCAREGLTGGYDALYINQDARSHKADINNISHKEAQNAQKFTPPFCVFCASLWLQKLTCLEANGSTSVNNPFSRCICSEAKLAACGSCVTSMIVLFNSWLRVESICNISSPDRASRFPVGSSARMRSGSVTIARAMATRCSWPPDS